MRTLPSTVAAGEVFVMAYAAASLAILGSADQTSNANWFNGNDAIVLRRGGETGAILDVIGQIGTNPGTEWGTGLLSTADNTLRRKDRVRWSSAAAQMQLCSGCCRSSPRTELTLTATKQSLDLETARRTKVRSEKCSSRTRCANGQKVEPAPKE